MPGLLLGTQRQDKFKEWVCAGAGGFLREAIEDQFLFRWPEDKGGSQLPNPGYKCRIFVCSGFSLCCLFLVRGISVFVLFAKEVR